MALSRYRDGLVRHAPPAEPWVYPPLIPEVLTSCFDVLVLPPRPFRTEKPLTRTLSTWCLSSFRSAVHTLSYARITMALAPSFSHRALMHRPALPSSLLILARRKTCAALTLPPCSRSTLTKAGHCQACPGPSIRPTVRAETLSNAAGLTAHTAIVLFGSSTSLATAALLWV